MLGLHYINKKLFWNLSKKSRARKIELLHETFKLGNESRILDIGGQLDPNGGQLIDSHPFKKNITVLNIDPLHLKRIKEKYPEIRCHQGEAQNLPFPNKSFDLAYSNAVIEHLPSFADQQSMANEIRRVSKAWFVTTPNRFFPFEFHTRLPLVGFLPTPLMQAASILICYNHLKGKYAFGLRRDPIRLLSSKKFQKLFPESVLIPIRVTFMAETLVIVGPKRVIRKDPPSPRKKT